MRLFIAAVLCMVCILLTLLTMTVHPCDPIDGDVQVCNDYKNERYLP